MSQSKNKKVLRAVRRPFEWTGIFLATLIVPCLTVKGCDRVASLVAWVGINFMQRDKRVARANLKIIYGERLTPHREHVIIYHSFRNMAAVAVKLFWICRNSRRRLEQLILADQQIADIIREAHPSINISAHIGNWELLSQICILNGVPMTSVAKSIGSKAMTSRLRRIRSCIGQTIVPHEGALHRLVYALRHNSSLGLLVDQLTPVKQGGAWLKFFGIHVDVSISPARLSRRLNVPIIVAWSRPLKDGRYKIEFLKRFDPDPDVDDITRSQEILDLFEQIIRRHPSCWALNYRRWRTVHPDDPPERYPFYARKRNKNNVFSN